MKKYVDVTDDQEFLREYGAGDARRDRRGSGTTSASSPTGSAASSASTA
jgi:hypothetical protein